MRYLVFEEFKKNWLINILGLIFFLCGAFVLNNNEGKIEIKSLY